MEATFHHAAGLVHYYGRRYGDAVTSERRALEILRCSTRSVPTRATRAERAARR
jgi:hypothetical protein